MAKKNILTQSKLKRAGELAQQGAFTEAKILLEQVCNINRVDADAWFMLGIVNGKLDHVGEAEECLRKAVLFRPEHALAHFNLGRILQTQDRLEEAERSLRNSLRYDATQIATYEVLKSVLLALDKSEEAARCQMDMLKLYPENAETIASKGSMLHVLSRLDEAIDCYRKALQLNPGRAALHDSLASALCEQGKFEEAIASHRRALQLSPFECKFHSNYLLTLQYLPEPDPAEVFAEHCKSARVYAEGLSRPISYANTREPRRRIRVGYVSSDFRMHSVAFFFEPLLGNHDAREVETFCYSGVQWPDAMTQNLQGMAHNWRNIAGFSDEQVASIVLADGIDILVDMAGYTGDCRLGLFARKPAPIQVSWLGYLDTTGLEAIDYRLTDGLTEPEGQDAFFVESLVRLPGCFLCYKPMADAPGVVAPPVFEKNYITFGSFNALHKVNGKVVKLWVEVLRAVPGSRFYIKSPPLTDAATRERLLVEFEAQGIGRDRVELIGHTASQAEHMNLYGHIDIALDTFPYNGATTTCEALWMGVPVVALAGERHRMGVSLLSAAGMDDWIAETPEQYVALAVEKARDLPGLAKLRSGLRDWLSHSRLCDGTSFARDVESAYRNMWVKFCG